MPDHIQRPAWFPFADALHRAVVAHRNRVSTPDGQEGEPLTAYDDRDGIFLAMGLGGEAGEVLNEFKKWMRGDYSRGEFLLKVSAELADVRCMLELVACAVGVELDEVTPRKLEDFEQKLIARGWIKGPVAVRPPPADAVQFFQYRCPNGHSTAFNFNPGAIVVCTHEDPQGATCGAAALPVTRG